jgi:hypothetical protein
MGDLKRDPKGRPIFIELPSRADLMEAASTHLWECLLRLSVDQLKALLPTGPYRPLIDALIEVRLLMGEDAPTVQQIEDLARRQHDRAHLLHEP